MVYWIGANEVAMYFEEAVKDLSSTPALTRGPTLSGRSQRLYAYATATKKVLPECGADLACADGHV